MHVHVARRGDEYTGVLLAVDHLFSVASVVALFALAAAAGGRLVRAAGVPLDEPLEALLFWTATGIGALAIAILCLGLLVGVQAPVLAGVLAGAALLGRRELGELPALVKNALSSLRARADRFSLGAFSLIAVFLILRALAPPADWDGLMYHLRVPAQFLERGAVYLPDDNAHVAFVGLPHMLYLPLLAVGSPAGPALVSALCTIGIALTGFALAARFLDARTAGFNLAVLWGSTILLLVAVTPRTDTILAFYLLLVQYAVIRAARSGDPRFLYLGAVLGGMAIGVKYNALLYLLALAPFGLWSLRKGVQRPAATLAIVAGLGLAAAFPWLLKNALLLQDPLYPFLGGRRLEPWLARLYGGPSISPVLDPAVFELVWQSQARFNLVDLFAAPGRITMEAEGKFYHPNFLLLLLPLWLVFWKNEVLLWLAGPALCYVALGVSLQPTTSLRYLIPAVAPLTLVALHSYASSTSRLLPAKAVQALLAATALFVLKDTGSEMLRQLNQGRYLQYLVGSVSRKDFLRASTGGYVDVVSFVNERLAAQSRVLMLFEARGYYFRVPLLQDNVIMNWPLLSGKATAPDCLRSAGITHVLVNASALQYYARRGVDLGPLRLSQLNTFTRACLTPIYSSGGVTLFRVRDEAAGTVSGGAPSLR